MQREDGVFYFKSAHPNLVMHHKPWALGPMRGYTP